MTQEYVAFFTTSEQVSMEDYRVIHPSLKITGSTTIKEIDDFYRKYYKVGFMEVKVVGLQIVIPSPETNTQL